MVLQKHFTQYRNLEQEEQTEVTESSVINLGNDSISFSTQFQDNSFLFASCVSFGSAVGFSVPFAVWFLILVVQCCVSIVGTFGNILIFGAVAVEKSLQNVGSVFILNLATADMAVTSYIMPLAIINFIHGGRNPFGHFICQLTGYLGQVCCTVSTFSLALIALNRFYFIVRFGEYSKTFSRERTIVMICATWALALSIASPNLLGWGHIRFDHKTLICSYDRTYSFSYTCFLLLAAVTFPFTVTVAAYVKVFRKFAASKRKFAAARQEQKKAAMKAAQAGNAEVLNKMSRSAKTAKKNQWRLIKSLLLVTVVFNVSWTPYSITVILDYKDKLPALFHLTVTWMCMLNSCMNSLIYGVMNKPFRCGYKKIACFWNKKLLHNTSST
ncbi:melatonin receptor type 1C-like [Convolutriloba macropyga]|uniref:melatonin receptor type 1C-like n=1 Tax=Convolutriloba macropyga TaxID=536237 RepID=UPI003F527AAE